MSFECLSNELLLEIFDYLSSINILQCFYNLNIRFNKLIYFYFKSHCLNFQSSSKFNFDLICQKYLSIINNQIISLRLSDDDNTPKQIDLFFSSYNLSFQQFSYLKSLSIHQIYSFNSLKILIYQLPYLKNLQYLKITRYFILYNDIYDIQIINSINCLSKLIYCSLDITNNDNDSCFTTLSIISSTLKNLSIPHLDCNLKQLLYVIKHIPNLESLNAYLTDSSNIFSIPSINFLSIKILKLRFQGSLNTITTLFKIMPNIEKLKIELISTYINGYEWENLIENNLLYINLFQFKMSLSLSNSNSKENKINEILNSFQTKFWLEKHQWFVQCSYNLIDILPIVYIYTLPYSFKHFLYNDNDQIKPSTNFSNHIHYLYYNHILSENYSISNIYLNNIHYLYLTIPYNDSFYSIIKKYDQIKFLHITLVNSMNKNDELKLQILFNKLNNLYSLKFYSWTIEDLFPIELKNSSIRQIDLRGVKLFYNNFQCQKLCQSSIIQQCKIIFINLKQENDIIYLIQHLNNLCILIVKCQLLKQNENIIQWLEQYLPSTCAISMCTDNDDSIRIWIR